MQAQTYFSVRMRASQNGSHEEEGKHISGGECMATYHDIPKKADALLDKALHHARGNPDFMQITVEKISSSIEQTEPLSISTHEAATAEEGQLLAKELLKREGVPVEVIDNAYKQMAENSVIRGAMLFDICTGQRVDAGNDRGIRVSRMDWNTDNFEKWAQHHKLPNSPRVQEALTLATKVSQHPGSVAELCWSDDPDYVTGYVAGKKGGYQRITKLKQAGDETGCRVFFVNGEELHSYVHYLEKQPMFIQWRDNQ
ncbi:6-carboxyhexanoate-CoA ligase [Alteribacillus persepolensis]|uniref:6-carboxyhexanoate--CoA ligase n=1 Tax=Alteribacillus persepolensis TaxID=568899 RepID=A0A1G8FY81_9BACI|nr:6-carboxyhexanoate--CoA ligase [Alteribacillus persepolensis]SDH87124.1 6-carboxyhexanoate-CoA ligase [Alteribacillus persepolensis]